MTKPTCKKHNLREAYEQICERLTYYSNKRRLWCTYKCNYETGTGCEPHFLDGTPAKEYLECDYPTDQCKCKFFKDGRVFAPKKGEGKFRKILRKILNN